MKPRFGAKVDEVQPGIREVLEQAGAKVEVLDVSHEGAPDLLVGWLGVLSLLECKARLGKLSEAQQRERDAWARVGVQVHTVRSQREALDAIGLGREDIADRLAAFRGIAQGLAPRRAARAPKWANGARLRPNVRPPPPDDPAKGAP